MIICWPEDMHPDNCGGDCARCKEEAENVLTEENSITSEVSIRDDLVVEENSNV